MSAASLVLLLLVLSAVTNQVVGGSPWTNSPAPPGVTSHPMPIEALRGTAAPTTSKTCGTFACPVQMILKPKSDDWLCADNNGCSVEYCCRFQATLAMTTTPISVIEEQLYAVLRQHKAEDVDSSHQRESDAKLMPIYVVVLLSLGCLGMAVAASACKRRRQKTTYRFMEAMVEADLEADFEEEDRTISSDDLEDRTISSEDSTSILLNSAS